MHLIKRFSKRNSIRLMTILDFYVLNQTDKETNIHDNRSGKLKGRLKQLIQFHIENTSYDVFMIIDQVILED